jgi:predicted DNA-binding transcriptional regulator YafY
MLSKDETEAVVLGLRYVDQRGDAVLAKAAAGALAKIAAVLSPATQEALQNPTALPGPSGWGFPINEVDLTALRRAIRSQAKLRIDYEDAGGARTNRVIWPIALGFMNEARALVAWCELRQGYRTFRSDRIASAQETGERYKGRRSILLQGWRAQMNPDEGRAFTPDRN